MSGVWIAWAVVIVLGTIVAIRLMRHTDEDGE